MKRTYIHRIIYIKNAISSISLPALIGCYFVLAFYWDNIRHFPVSVITAPIVYTITASAILVPLLMLFLKNKEKASLVAAIILLINFSYGRVCELFPKAFCIRIGNRAFAANLIMFPAAGIVLLVLGLVVWKLKPKHASVVARFSRVFACFLCIISLTQIVRYSRNRISATFSTELNNETIIRTPTTTNERLPHILYVVLDGYARGDILRELYNYDNTTFYKNLENMGFYVASNALANYCFTPLSQSSTLNMEYLHNLAELPRDTNDRSLAIKFIENNKTSHILQDAGYKIFTTKSMYRATETFNGAQNISDNEFGRELFLRSWANQFLRAANARTYKYNEKRDNLYESFAMLPDLVKREEPHFIYCHVLFPHNPFVFQRDGTPFNPAYNVGESSPFEPDKYREQYVNQLIYISSQTEMIVSQCISNSVRPLVIILQSDHGPHSTMKWSAIEKSYLLERFGILNAFFFSDGPPTQLSDSLSAVNNFRVVLNNVLGLDMPMLQTHCYFTPPEGFYNFTDVTAIVSNKPYTHQL